MGKDKALLKVNEKTFIEQLMDEFDDFEEKIIARGNNSLINSSWHIISDQHENCGPIGGLHAALSSCRSDALFVVSCDSPFMKRALADRLIDALTDEYDGIVAKGDDGRIHPLCAIYKKKTYRIFEQQILSDNYRLMHALNKMNVRYIELNNETQQLRNINTPDDYLEIK